MALGSLEIGLSDSELQQIQSILGLFPHIEEVFLFGSRARGDYKRGSDIDLSIKGEDVVVLIIRMTLPSYAPTARLRNTFLFPNPTNLIRTSKILLLSKT